jgi:tight adherence protein B
VARVRAVIVAVIGSVLALAFARAARRYAVTDRLRADRRPARPRLHAGVQELLARALDAAAIDVTPARAVSTWVWSITVAAVFGFAVGGAQVALGSAAVALVALPVVLVAMRDRRGRQVAAAVPEMLEGVASELRSGGTIMSAITAGAVAEGPLGADLARVDARLRLGATLSDALRAWSRERTVAGVDASAGALAMCASVGGASADALDGLASSLRDRLAVASEARALAAQARMSAIVVGGAPVAYVAWSAIIDPHSLQVLLGTAIGRVCLAAGVALEVFGAWWMHGIVRSGSAM